MIDIDFVDELPPDRRMAQGSFWQALIDNPGRWAVWPGSAKTSATQLAAQRSRNGIVFQGAKRGGVVYFRCVVKP